MNNELARFSTNKTVNQINLKPKKTKILLVVANLGKGGMERQLTLLLSAGVDPSLSFDIALFRNKIEYPVPSNIKLIQLNKKNKIDIPFLFRLFKLLCDSSYDIIHSKIPGVNEYIIVLSSLLRKKNFIIEFRSSGSWEYLNYKKAAILLRIFGLKHCRIVCNSEKALREMEKEFKSFHLFPKAICIKNGIDLDRFSKKTKTLNPDEFLIGFVGRIDPQKNLFCLIEAFALFKKDLISHSQVIPRLQIFGHAIDNSYLLAIRNFIKSLELEQTITILDPVDNIEECYNKFDLFVLPSHEEGTPNVLLEAMACELVCLASTGANTDKFLMDAFTFPSKESQRLFSLIKRTYSAPQNELLDIGRSNRAFVINNFALSKMVNQYEALWHQ